MVAVAPSPRFQCDTILTQTTPQCQDRSDPFALT